MEKSAVNNSIVDLSTINKRIILIRHGEQATTLNRNIKEEDSEIGLTIQGAIRAYYLPHLIDILLDNKYELHTYTHDKGIGPVSRSYYTVLPLMSTEKCQHVILYKKSDDINELVANIKSSISKFIVVCWEHLQIPNIVKKLLNLNKEETPNYNKICKRLKYKFKNNKIEEMERIKIKPKIFKKIKKITRCNYHLTNDNNKIKNEFIKNDIPYSLIWDIESYNNNNNNDNKCIIYPGLIVKNKSKVNIYV